MLWAIIATTGQTALAATLRYCPSLTDEPENRLAAIMDFTFNLGTGRLQASTLRRRVNQRDWTAAKQEVRRWAYGFPPHRVPPLVLHTLMGLSGHLYLPRPSPLARFMLQKYWRPDQGAAGFKNCRKTRYLLQESHQRTSTHESTGAIS